MEQLTLLPALASTVSDLETQIDLIPATRKEQLAKLAAYLSEQSGKTARLNFICTHNSRRSHLGMIWAAVAAARHGRSVSTYSGGTEATAFNPRAVAALQRAGFRIGNPGGENPHYRVAFAEEVIPLTCFSKTYDDPTNPTADFAAIMTCSEADQGCPFIPGAAWRLPLTYEDPKEADDTPEETARYDERTAQIGREILYAFSLV
ncbi:MAG: protein-tyrosine-phosphatase [Bacteroidota bacterium]